MMKTGEGDMDTQWLNIEAHEEIGAEPHITTYLEPSLQLFHLTLNTQKPPTDDINFRYAMAYAFDYDTACNEILKGATQAQGPVPILVPGHSKDAFQFTHDLTKAEEYLAMSKYAPDDYTLEYMYDSATDPKRKVGLLLQANLAELGITMEVNGVPWGTMVDVSATKEQTPHLCSLYDTLKFPHLDSHTFGIYHSTAPRSYRTMSWYDNPEVDQLLNDARAAPSVDEQMAKYKEAQDIISSDAPSIYVANQPHRVDIWDHVTGYNYVGLLGYDIEFWYYKVDMELKKQWLEGEAMLFNFLQAIVISSRDAIKLKI
jgi:peptide/nickel transport system substrate-binding protein